MKKFVIALGLLTVTSSVWVMNSRNLRELEAGASFNTRDPHFNLSGLGNSKIKDYVEHHKPDNMVVLKFKSAKSEGDASKFMSRFCGSIKNGNICFVEKGTRCSYGICLNICRREWNT